MYLDPPPRLAPSGGSAQYTFFSSGLLMSTHLFYGFTKWQRTQVHGQGATSRAWGTGLYSSTFSVF